MKLKLPLFLIFAAVTLPACESTPSANTPVNLSNQAVTNSAPSVNTNQIEQPINSAVNIAVANTAVNLNPNAAQPEDTPASAIKAVSEASNKNDAAALKQLFNRKSLEMVAGQAKENGKTVDETLLKQQIVTLAKSATEGRNQHVEGDSATVEIRTSKTGPWQKIFFTKEDGRWKIAMDKFMEEIVRQVEESTKDLDMKSGDEKDK